MPVFRNTISLSNATVFIESNSPFLKTALQHMPFGPSHCCALNKGTDHKRAVSIWATKGKWDEREGNLSRIGNNGIVENREQRHRRLLKRGSSALLPSKLVSPDPLEFLRPKGYIVLPRACKLWETIEIMSCEYLFTTLAHTYKGGSANYAACKSCSVWT